ncbi:uncharacterized protein LOC144093502 [Amblyomma americanum]
MERILVTAFPCFDAMARVTAVPAYLTTFIAVVSSLEWNCTSIISKKAAGELKTQDELEGLLHCSPESAECPPASIRCGPVPHAVTCSCAENCELYGDCCWKANVAIRTENLASCVTLNTNRFYDWSVYMVTKCHSNWVDEEVKYKCDKSRRFKEVFYKIPVTSQRMVTYVNAFCALCNYDLDETSNFWNSSGFTKETFQVELPHFVEKKSSFLRPCSPSTPLIKACPEGTSQEVARKCSAYFSPVSYNGSKPVYKNVFCALCNGVALSLLKCVRTPVILQKGFRDLHFDYPGPNLLTLLRPIVRNDSCFSWYRGKCYIRSAQYRNGRVAFPPEELLAPNSTDVKVVSRQPYTVKNYLTIACLSLSLACLFLKAIVYAICKNARTFSSKNILCLSGTLFCSHALFLVAHSIRLHSAICTVLATVLHYGFLSTFVWTSVLSYDIWKNVATICKTSRKQKDFLVYCLVSWTAPLLFVVFCVIVDYLAPEFKLAPRYGRYGCWIGSVWGQVVFFLFPVAVMLIVDVGLYAHIVIYVRRTSKQAGSFDFRSSGEGSNMALFVKLAAVMGITWLIGFIGAFVNVLAVDIVVIVFVGIQGVYLFVAFKDYTHLSRKWFTGRGDDGVVAHTEKGGGRAR